MKKMLIIYYSWSNGNTKKIAEKLQKATDADIERIETEVAYSGSYNEVVNQGQEEVESGYKPKIKGLNADINDYDVIAIGTPTWWYTMAPAVLTFLSENDWKGKTVIPFSTHGGWPGHTLKDIEKLCKSAEVKEGKAIQFDSTGGAKLVTKEEEINNWIEKVKNNL